MNWIEPLDKYCERVTPDFWAEPVNAVSNLSFILAAWFALRLVHNLGIRRLDCYWLILLVFLIGIGSFLFHTFANHWSLLADIVPIYIFQLSIIAFYGAAIAKLKRRSQLGGSAMLLAGFIVLTFLFSLFPRDLLNGSIIYIPVVLIFVGLGIYQAMQPWNERYTLLVASLLLVLALVFRTVDADICRSLLVGTHFLWHLINGCVLYLVIKAYMGVVAARV